MAGSWRLRRTVPRRARVYRRSGGGYRPWRTDRSPGDSPEWFGDVGPAREPLPVAHEVAHDVAAVGERVHDVLEIGGVRQPDGVPQLMDAGEVDDRVPQERVVRGQPRDGWALEVDAGRHVEEGPRPAVDQDGAHFPVHAAPGINPDHVDERVLRVRLHEPQPPAALPRPGLEGRASQLVIRRLVSGDAGPVVDEVGDGFAGTRVVLGCRLRGESRGAEHGDAHHSGETPGSAAQPAAHRADQHPYPLRIGNDGAQPVASGAAVTQAHRVAATHRRPHFHAGLASHYIRRSSQRVKNLTQ